MQKKIIVLAIASALTAPALAFAADTTVYGILDAGYANTSKSTAGVKTGFNAYGFSTMTSSRLGITHSEDLGNGMTAMIKVETGLGSNIMAGTSQTAITGPNPFGVDFTKGQSGAGTTLGDRELNASLKVGDTTAKLGFGSTMIRDISLGYAPDPGGNLIGNVLHNDATLGSNRATGLTVTQAFGAISGAVQLTQKTTTTDGAADLKDKNGFLLGAQYADGPISAAFAYQSQETTTASSDSKQKIAILAGSFDMGVAKLIGELANIKVDNSVIVSPIGSGARTYESIGAQAPFGPVLGFVQLSHGSNKLATVTGVAGNSRSISGYTIGGKYNLSKLAYGYVSVGNTKLDAGTQTNTGETKISQIALGFVRTF